MKDTELYRHLLGIEPPWTVDRVDLDVSGQRIDVKLAHKRGRRWPCPECGEACGLHDHAEERTWRHLDSCQFLTFIHAAIPRVDCPEHGVRQVRVPWAEPNSRFTLLFETLAIRLLLEASNNAVARLLGISEALFRTLKYRPSYPTRPFASLAAARAWVERFVRWYNEEHRHSALNYVTPRERHEGRHLDILAQRRRVYEAARARHPERWTGPTRNCDPIPVVCLNPERAANHVIKQSA